MNPIELIAASEITMIRVCLECILGSLSGENLEVYLVEKKRIAARLQADLGVETE